MKCEYRSEGCDVDYIAALNVVFVRWKKFCSGEAYRAPLLHALEIMRGHPGCQYVADTRQGFENEAADTAWVFEVFLPRAAQTGCRAVFFIIDRDNTLKRELEGQAAELRRAFAVHYCFGLDEVADLLRGD